MLTEPAVADDLAEAEAREARWDAANLRLMRHAHTRATALPADAGRGAGPGQLGLREGLARGAGAADFAPVAPYLAEVVR